MPKNDTWQDGNALDTMGEMDSTGSCDSVVSFNSCFSDDSSEFLSAEEKACLTFLEETIQSLDTEDDSGLSNDEPDQTPVRGNVATKAARLSTSIVFNKPPGRDMPMRHSEHPLTSGSPGKNDILNYMVPTPCILANRPPSRKKSVSDAENVKLPAAVNVVVIPPPHKTKSKNDTDEEKLNKPPNASRRGPLSYEGLVQLRKTASVRKTNAAEAKPQEQLVSANKVKEHTSSKPVPPPVAPKPKIHPQTNPQGPANSKTDPNVPRTRALSVDHLMNPEKVRLEALCKLGLLKVESDTRQLGTKGQNFPPPRVAPKPDKPINWQVHSGSPLHQRSVSDICTDPPCPQHDNVTSAGKAATLERTNRGPSGSELDTEQVSSSRSKSQHVQGFSVPVHSIGKDRREALQKLGLLKN